MSRPTIDSLTAQLHIANGVLRSAKTIADREGWKTNWAPFRRRVELVLEQQREILFPKPPSPAVKKKK